MTTWNSAAAEYAKIPYIPPYLQSGYHRYADGSNFAPAGAGAIAEINQGFVSVLSAVMLKLTS